MKHTLRKHVAAAAMLLAPFGAALVAQPAAAQYAPQYRVAEPDQGRILNMSLDSNAGLAPGATLRVHVRATPGARWATVALGNGVRVPLREREPGEYVGTHVIARGEHIDPSGLMRVRAGWGEGPVTLAFNYPTSFQALAMGAGAMPHAVVNSFTMWPREDLSPGDVMHFRLQGTPRARAWVDLPGAHRAVALREVRPGLYTGSYTVRRHDDTDRMDDARAVLRSGHDRVVIRADQSRTYGYNR